MAKSGIAILLTLFLLLSGIVGGCTGQVEDTPEEGTAEWHIERGHKLFLVGVTEGAILEYTKAIELDPTNANAYVGRGDVYSAQILDYTYYTKKDKSTTDLAIADFTKAIQLDPNLAAAYTARARVYNYIGEYDLAITDCNWAMSLDPRLVLAYRYRADAYKGKGQYDLAIADYTKAIEFDPNLSATYAGRADIYDMKGDYDLAVADYTKAIEISSDFLRVSYEQRYEKSQAYRYRELSGTLPTLVKGDKWVGRFGSKGIEYTMTTEVIDTSGIAGGKICYILESSITPPVEYGISKAIAWLDRLTFDVLKIESSGTHEGRPFSIVTSTSHQYADYITGYIHYPLAVGRQWEVEEVATITFTAMEQKQTETKTNTYVYKVEEIEQITVPAGTFKCFKIVQYDKNGNSIKTSWVSDQTKHHEIKEIDHATGDVLELVSYSVSR